MRQKTPHNQTTRGDVAIIGVCMVVFGSIAPFFHCMPAAGRHSDNISGSSGVFLSSQLPCGSHGAGSTPDSNRCYV